MLFLDALLQAAKSAKEVEASKVGALQQQLELLQEEQRQRQAKEVEVEAMRLQLAELQVKAEEQAKAEEEQQKAATAAPAAVSGGESPVAAGKRKPSTRNKEEMERLRARISQMKMEAIGDYEYMMMQVGKCVC